MRTLDLPEHDAAEDFDVCVERAEDGRKERLLAKRQAVLDLFEAYGDGGWHWALAQDHSELFNAEELEDLLWTYDLTFSRRSLSRIRSKALLGAGKLCPYCLLEEPKTLDHFLPKSRFQAFASHAPNLVPMCGPCNTLKGTKGSAIGEQFFTHAYFDEIAEQQPFLIAQVAVGSRSIATNFMIDFGADLPGSVLNRLSYQFSILRLGARYQREAIDVVHGQAQKIKEMHADRCPIEEVTLSVADDAEAEALNMGRSYWRAALLGALAGNARFCAEGYLAHLFPARERRGAADQRRRARPHPAHHRHGDRQGRRRGRPGRAGRGL